MIDDQKRAELDQSLAAIQEALPAAWRAIYQGCSSQGFSESQAMDLLKTYILGLAAGKVVPPSDGGADDAKPPTEDV